MTQTNSKKQKKQKKKHLGVTLDLKLTFEEHNYRTFAQATKYIAKNNFSYYLQTLCKDPI